MAKVVFLTKIKKYDNLFTKNVIFVIRNLENSIDIIEKMTYNA